MPRKRLTVKQEKFVAEYIKRDGNGTQAALAVYNTERENTAATIAEENLRKPNIRERVDEALVKLELTPEWTLNKFKTIADVGTEVTVDGRMRDTMGANRALENVAHIQNLYPSAANSLEIGDGHIKLSWGGTDIPQE